MHLFLSPHPDDAVLSCGGQIAQLTRNGEKVFIFTLMGADPPPGFKHNDFTQALYKRWGLGEDAPAVRRKEDSLAGKMLGAEVKFGPYADAVHRVSDSGRSLYTSEDAIFGVIAEDDPALQARRAAVIQVIMSLFSIGPKDVIHVPLAIGSHVDHQLVRDMGKAIAQWRPNNQIYFYEDYPYSLQGQAAIRDAVNTLEVDLTRTLHTIDAPAVDAKIAAVGRYKSQLSTFWDSENQMAREVRAFINQVGGESEWRLLNSY